MAFTFYRPRPMYTDKNGRPYVGIIHHLIPDKFNYRPANLLCWLTRTEHYEADRRQRALRKVLTDLSVLGYDRLRKLQDPRAMSPETFDVELQKLTDIYAKQNIS